MNAILEAIDQLFSYKVETVLLAYRETGLIFAPAGRVKSTRLGNEVQNALEGSIV